MEDEAVKDREEARTSGGRVRKRSRQLRMRQGRIERRQGECKET